MGPTFVADDGIFPPRAAGDAPVPAGSEHGFPGEELNEEAKKQIPLNDARMELEQVAAEAGADGFAAISPDFDNDRLDVYWKGELPSVLRERITQIRERFTVVVHEARYTWAELDVRIRRLQAVVTADERFSFVAAIAMEPDRSGIRILVTHPNEITEAAEALILTIMEPRIPFHLDYKDFVVGIKPVAAGSRWDDQPPFYGGSVIETREFVILTGALCSTAFAVRNAANTERGVLTAKHCGEYEDWYTPGDEHVGVSNTIHDDNDSMGIMWGTAALGFPDFVGRIYHGSYTTSRSGGISGSGLSVADELLCTGGAFSGTMCSNKVIYQDLYFSGVGPMFVTRQTEGNAAAGNGDSGGPVYRLEPDARYARGVISAIDSNRLRACRGVPGDNERECSDTVISVELQPALADLGLFVRKAPF